MGVVLTLLAAVPARAAALDVSNPSGQTLRVGGADGAWVVQLPPAGANPEVERVSEPIRRESTDPESGIVIDADGGVQGGGSTPGALGVSAASASATIDAMTTRTIYSESYSPEQGLELFGAADVYELSDGTVWSSGAGTFRRTHGRLISVAVSGGVIRYTLAPPADEVLYSQTDYDNGDHSSQGTLGASTPLVLEAVPGTATAVLRGEAEILANDATSYGDRFNYYSAPVGTVVPFETTYTLIGATWSPTTLDANVTYTYRGRVDFTAARYPPLLALELRGAPKVPPDSTVPFYAIAVYEGNAREDVTDAASWEVVPQDAARISLGQLETRDCDGVLLTLRATFERDGVSRSVQKTVSCDASASGDQIDAWETFQGDARHSGYVPVRLEPASFELRWQRVVGSGKALNPVTAADGKVFASLALNFQDETGLFVLDERSGDTVWSKDFGHVYSVNPPAFGYGNVYIQTGDHADNTYLWAFDSNTGDLLYRAPHLAQWEHYFAPTVFDEGVYVDGGSYGGMYGFSAFSGAQDWFTPLPQYDGWTPAVDVLSAYAYEGASGQGLYVLDRSNGAPRFHIPDPNYVWDGYTLDLAPVLGEQNDVLVIHGGRLIRFDLLRREIAWESKRAFIGQPSVANGTIYAIDGARLVALDETSGSPLWSWTPPAGQLGDTLVVTDTHVLASTGAAIYAVDLTSHAHVWSYPAAGQLALGRDSLFVAGHDGTLTAIGMRELTQASLERVEITGPGSATEGSSPAYRLTAHYSDGQVRDRTSLSDWSVSPDAHASFDAPGRLIVGLLVAPTEPVTIRAAYSEAGITQSAERSVQLVIGVPLGVFAGRSLTAARALKEQALADLATAAEHEKQAHAVLGDDRSKSGLGLMKHLRAAWSWATKGKRDVERSIDELDAAIDGLDD